MYAPKLTPFAKRSSTQFSHSDLDKIQAEKCSIEGKDKIRRLLFMLSRIAILLTFSWLYTLANAQPAAVSVKQLLMSDELLSARMVIAGYEKELRYFINNLETTDHRLP